MRKVDAGDGSFPSVNTCVHYLKVSTSDLSATSAESWTAVRVKSKSKFTADERVTQRAERMARRMDK